MPTYVYKCINEKCPRCSKELNIKMSFAEKDASNKSSKNSPKCKLCGEKLTTVIQNTPVYWRTTK